MGRALPSGATYGTALKVYVSSLTHKYKARIEVANNTLQSISAMISFIVQASGVNHIKLFWCKSTHSFFKARPFITMQ